MTLSPHFLVSGWLGKSCGFTLSKVCWLLLAIMKPLSTNRVGKVNLYPAFLPRMTSGRSRILKRRVPVCTWLLYLTKCNKAREVCPLGGCGACLPPPPQKIFSDLLRSFLVPAFWGEIARVGWPTTKSSHCVWSHSQNFKMWLRFTPEAAKQLVERRKIFK